MTAQRALEIIARMSDDDLIDMTTTCSDRGVALAAEMHLRKRYPASRKMPKKRKTVNPRPR